MVNQSVEHGIATTCTTQSLGEFLTEGLLKEQPTKVRPVHICASGGKENVRRKRWWEKGEEKRSRKKPREGKKGEKKQKAEMERGMKNNGVGLLHKITDKKKEIGTNMIQGIV